jgi:hypothetical protein
MTRFEMAVIQSSLVAKLFLSGGRLWPPCHQLSLANADSSGSLCRHFPSRSLENSVDLRSADIGRVIEDEYAAIKETYSMSNYASSR